MLPRSDCGPAGRGTWSSRDARLRGGRKRKVWPTPRSLRGTGESGEDTGHLGVTGEAILPGSPDGPLAWTGGRGWSLITATASPGRQASLRFSAGGALWRPLGAISIRGDGHGCCQGLIWPVWTGHLGNQGTLKAPFWAFLGVQWLRLCASNSGAQVRSLVGKLRSHMLCNAAKKTPPPL